MEGAITQTTESLLSLGPPGAVIVILLGVIWALYKDGKAKDALIMELQNSRIEETRETVTALTLNTGALEKLTEVVRARRES